MIDAPRGYVYIICWSPHGPIRIGWTTAPVPRLGTMQSSMPFPLSFYGVVRVFYPVRLEGIMHKLFALDRMRGEWFATRPGRAWAVLQQEAKAHDARWSIWKPVNPEMLRNFKTGKALGRIAMSEAEARQKAAIEEYKYQKSLGFE